MISYILKRILQSVLVLFVISIITFGLINAAPGEPAAAIYSGQMDRLTDSEKDRINNNLGIDKPAINRYCSWIINMINGDMGHSYKNGRSVKKLVFSRMPNTIRLFLASYSITILLSILIGFIAGGGFIKGFDRYITVISIITNVIPSILVAIILIYIFSVKLAWLPSSGCQSIFDGDSYKKWEYIVLPVTTIVLSHVGAFSRFIQESLKDEMNCYYVKVQRVNKISDRRIVLWAMKNALVPFVNYAGIHIPSFFSGFVVVEVIFSYPGLGNLIHTSIIYKDYPVIMAGIMVSGIVVVLSMLIIDIADFLLNPRHKKAVFR